MFALAGCGSDSAPATDGGSGSEAGADTGMVDTGVVDTATPDAGPGPASLLCVEECATNRDCFIGDADADYDCLVGRCRPSQCNEDLDCVAILSAAPPCSGSFCWRPIDYYRQACASDAECRVTIFGFTIQGSCVEVGSDGASPRNVCAPIPNATTGACPGAQQVISRPRVGASGMADVCAYHDARCNLQVCENPCADDNECLMVSNGWMTQCESDADCQAGPEQYAERRCIILGSKQVCAQPAVPMGTAPNRAPNCTEQNVEVELQGGGTWTACGQNTMCDPDTDACVPRCINNGDCGGSTPVCNRGTGYCECGTDSDCASVTGHPSCVAGSCQCSADADCAGFPNGDVCNRGACGCSAPTACDQPRTFDGTAWVCVDPSAI
ncbi:MAG: hypothetical protein OEY14_16170 [Myxococcales bacterium]|nr:hypothetical protein [Myxococcales bacterium]